MVAVRKQTAFDEIPAKNEDALESASSNQFDQPTTV